MKGMPMLALLIACCVTVAYAQGADTLQVSLLAFKNTTVDPGGGLADWLPGTETCAFRGVTCTINDNSGAAKILISLNLTGLNLAGTISPELGNFHRLQVLDLSNNAFSGPLPETLGTLPELSLLDVRNNQLNGTVPASLIHQGLELRADGNPALLGLPLATRSTQAPGVIVPRGAADSSSEVGPSTYEVYVVAVSVPLVVAFLVIVAAGVAVWRRRRKLAPSSQPLAMSALTNGSTWNSKPTPFDDSRTGV